MRRRSATKELSGPLLKGIEGDSECPIMHASNVISSGDSNLEARAASAFAFEEGPAPRVSGVRNNSAPWSRSQAQPACLDFKLLKRFRGSGKSLARAWRRS